MFRFSCWVLLVLLFLLLFYLEGFKGQVRWPFGPPHLTPKPSLVVFVVCFWFVFVCVRMNQKPCFFCPLKRFFFSSFVFCLTSLFHSSFFLFLTFLLSFLLCFVYFFLSFLLSFSLSFSLSPFMFPAFFLAFFNFLLSCLLSFFVSLLFSLFSCCFPCLSFLALLFLSFCFPCLLEQC